MQKDDMLLVASHISFQYNKHEKRRLLLTALSPTSPIKDRWLIKIEKITILTDQKFRDGYFLSLMCSIIFNTKVAKAIANASASKTDTRYPLSGDSQKEP